MLRKENIEKTIEASEQLLARYVKELGGLPQGTLRCKRKPNGKFLIYHLTFKNGQRKLTGVGKRNDPEQKLANALRYKWCVEECITILRKNIELLKKVSTEYKNFDIFEIDAAIPVGYKNDEWNFIEDKRHISLLKDLKSGDFSDIYNQDFVRKWVSEKENIRDKLVQGKAHYKEGLIFRTGLGFCVRSKSEAMICQSLHSYGVPSVYEQPLILNEVIYYPDFTILMPNGEEAIWEHFGLVDDIEYNEKMKRKLIKYIQNGYVFGKNLFVTSETRDNPVDLAEIKTIIENMILKR